MSTTGAFSFGIGNSTAASLPTSQSPAVCTSVSGFGGLSQGFSATPGFSLTPNVTATSSSAPTLNFNVSSTVAPTTTTTVSLSYGRASLPTSSVPKSVSFNFITSSSTTPISITKSNSIATSSTIISTTTTVTKPTITSEPDKSINYVQLQDLTNKWITDFEDLQKILINQTAEMINRDVILASNEDKIEQLVELVKNLKMEQNQVEQQSDFILSQQKDLEECLASLEDEVSSYFPELPADDMYKLTENIDSRLKKTLETSKEIITKINDKNRSSENITNPMVAIGHILNHHTNSIHMLENLNSEGQMKLNEVQKLFHQFM